MYNLKVVDFQRPRVCINQSGALLLAKYEAPPRRNEWEAKFGIGSKVPVFTNSFTRLVRILAKPGLVSDLWWRIDLDLAQYVGNRVVELCLCVR